MAVIPVVPVMIRRTARGPQAPHLAKTGDPAQIKRAEQGLGG
jgi:hypothetical protein